MSRRPSSTSFSAGTASKANPTATAFWADSFSPPQITSMAAFKPIKRGKRWVPPQPGKMPI